VFNCVTGTQRPRSGTIELIFDMIRRISDEGVAVLLVEQNAHKALAIANMNMCSRLVGPHLRELRRRALPGRIWFSAGGA